ncbi:hypothetical protein BTVI_44160 [Pitangus sulphuratus]|nr:hypothetical protein BTVI_44160 [Pitangus sulphuratus]
MPVHQTKVEQDYLNFTFLKLQRSTTYCQVKSCKKQYKVQLQNNHYWVLQGSIPAPTVFNICFNNLSDVTESTLGKFADDTKPGGVAITSVALVVIQRNLDTLEKWDATKSMKLNKGKASMGETLPGVLGPLLGFPVRELNTGRDPKEAVKPPFWIQSNPTGNIPEQPVVADPALSRGSDLEILILIREQDQFFQLLA